MTDIKPLDISNFPDIARTVAYEKLEPSEQRETAEPDREAFRREVEEVLGKDRLSAVRRGEASAFDSFLENPLDRLYATKAYMQSDPEHAVAHGDAVREVLSEIVDIEFENRKLATGEVERRGLTH
ncbi:hypothetical protein FDP25_16670 [Roseovarius sp. A21]|uniref:Uncharacterized protein n=1 Tax=Roseovarius bejariae TaxID=2576383 RepID=A0A844D189_9RHOB|nr:hypothetical protein [Roseovarius bejariae]